MLAQPLRQRVGAKIFLNNQVGNTVCAQHGKPRLQQLMKSILSNADRRVRPDHIKGDSLGAKLLRCLFGMQSMDVLGLVQGGIARGQVKRARVDVNGPNVCLGGLQAHGDG